MKATTTPNQPQERSAAASRWLAKIPGSPEGSPRSQPDNCARAGWCCKSAPCATTAACAGLPQLRANPPPSVARNPPFPGRRLRRLPYNALSLLQTGSGRIAGRGGTTSPTSLSPPRPQRRSFLSASVRAGVAVGAGAGLSACRPSAAGRTGAWPWCGEGWRREAPRGLSTRNDLDQQQPAPGLQAPP
jgi:hypothetical protein